jgi:hypothetical protein
MACPSGTSLHGSGWRIAKRIPVDMLPLYYGKKHLRLNTGTPEITEAPDSPVDE